MGALAGERQRPCANMDNARSLVQSCVNHEFIKSKSLGTIGARVLSRIFAKTRQAPGELPPRTTSHLLFGSNHRVAGTDYASRTDVKLPCSLEKHAHTRGPLSRSYCSSRRHAIAKYLPWDYFRLPAKRSCEFFDSALSCLAGRFLMFEKIEAAPQQLDTTGPAQPDGRHGSRRGGYRYQVE
jgi:hypothetical protein